MHEELHDHPRTEATERDRLGRCDGRTRSGANERTSTVSDAEQLALLAVGGAREVLARLSDGDPLGLDDRLRGRARARRVLVPQAALGARVRAVVARRAVGYRGRPRLDRFLASCVDEALDGWIEGRVAPTEHELERRLRAFDRCRREVRDAFFRVFLFRESPDAVARSTDRDLTRLARDLRRALDILVPASGGERAP